MPDNSAPPFVDPQVPPPVDHRFRRSCNGGGSRASWAIFLILFGVLLFLSNLGLFPIQNFWKYWPLYLIILGLSKLIGGSSHERGPGVVLTSVGAIFLASNLGWFHLHGHDWMSIAGIVLIVVGLGSFQAARRGGPSAFTATNRADRHADRAAWRAERAAWRAGRDEWQAQRDAWRSTQQPGPFVNPESNAQSFTSAQDDQWLRDAAVFGGIKRRVETNQFMGGKIEAIFGSLDLDMRNIAMPPAQSFATLHVNSVFGAVKLRVPQHWRVSLQVAGAFGAAEDRTVPIPRTDLPPSTLIIKGSSAFGAVEIDN